MVHFDVPPEISQAAMDQTEELSILEASKIYAVVKSTLEKLALVGVINVDLQEQAMTLTKSVGEEISVKIRLQRALEVEFQALIEEQQRLRGKANKLKQEENEANIKVVAAKLRASIEALCDKLKDNPNVAENMAKVASERQSLQGLLTKSLEELLIVHKIPCVTEAVMVEHYKRREIKEVVDREKTAARAVSTLRMELRDERDDHDQAVRKRKAEIATLKEELRVQNKATFLEQAHTALDLQCTIGCTDRLQEEEIEDLEKELRDLEKMTVLEEHAHRASATQLLKLQADLTKQIKQWGAKLQVDLQEKKRSLDELKSKYKATLLKFKEVEKEHAKEASLKSERELKAKEAQDAEAARMELEKVQRAAVTVIQAHWKGFKARQNFKGAKDKGKKGKKKK